MKEHEHRLLTGPSEQRQNPVKRRRITTSEITKREMYFRREEMGGNPGNKGTT